MPTDQPDRARDSGGRGASTGSRGPLIHVSTRCASIDELVEKFSGFASEGALVLPAAGELPLGTEGRFVIRLADQSVAMRGRCRVTALKTVPGNPPGTGPRRTLLHVALLEMQEGSGGVHARLLAHRRGSVPLAVAPSESEPTIVSPQSRVPPPPLRTPPPPPLAAPVRTRTMIGVAPGESRVPGAAFTLPANPLAALRADDLASFIDSTLFETDDDDATTERAPRPLPEIEVPIEEGAPERATRAGVVGAVERASPVRSRTPSPRRLAICVAPYALCLLVGLLVGRAWRAPARISTPETTPAAAIPGAPARATEEAPARATAEAPGPVQAPPPRPAATTEEPAAIVHAPPARIVERVSPEPAAPKTGATGCTARIVTVPTDAKVVWSGMVLGQSPIQAARIPCGGGTLTIEHERYQPVTREVTAEPSAVVVVSQRLHRPPGTLIVNSSPPRAYVTINDQMLGAAPRRIAAARFEQLSIRATFPGYLPWTKRIYLKEPTTTITAQLVPTGRRADTVKHPPATH
jgi:hypothetical protein